MGIKNKITKAVITLSLALTVCATPITADAKVKASVPRYTTVSAVVGCDREGNKNLQVFYSNGQIHEFNSDFELQKRFKVGDTVKVHFKTKRTKTVKDDIVLDVYKFKNHNKILKMYSEEYKHYFKTIKTCQEEEG